MTGKEQALLARIIDLFAAKFGKKAVLRGGMVLKILGSPRYTNDLDYVFIPFSSKKEIVSDILESLTSIRGATIRHELNSQCLRIHLTVDGTATVQIEAKVAKEEKTDIASSRLLSTQFNLPPRIIHIVDHSVSMANKMSAWNERRLIRDVYDTCFFLRMNIKPDIMILRNRLKEPRYAKTVKKADYFSGKAVAEFVEFMREHVNSLTQKQIEGELADYLIPDELVGLSLEFKATFASFSI